jgi:hypothetical protein
MHLNEVIHSWRSALVRLGSEVFIKGCPRGTPGVVVRFERNRVVVWWADLDYLSRHTEETLMVAEACDAMVSTNGAP